MAKQTNLRFESREIAVILSLFIFVSLLMFTVGIVVGKGLAQAKYQGNPQVAANEPRNLSSDTHEESPKPSSTSVSSNPPIGSAHLDTHSQDVSPEKSIPPQNEVALKTDEPLELKPKKSGSVDVHEDLQLHAHSSETQNLLRDPKLSDLFETDKTDKKVAPALPLPKPTVAAKETTGDIEIEMDYTVEKPIPRKVASVPKSPPASYAFGPYTVQIASYSDENQAKERVETLKTLGFPHAYFSTIELGDKKETWFRVWLGYYPSQSAAKAGGDALQARGEVKNYLVRKSENNRSKN